MDRNYQSSAHGWRGILDDPIRQRLADQRLFCLYLFLRDDGPWYAIGEDLVARGQCLSLAEFLYLRCRR